MERKITMPFAFFQKGKTIKELRESVSYLQEEQKHLCDRIEAIRVKTRFSHAVSQQQQECDELERAYTLLDANAAALLPALASVQLNTELQNAECSIFYGIIVPKGERSLADIDIAVQNAADYGLLGAPLSESQHLCVSNIQTYMDIGKSANALPFAGFAHMNLSNKQYADSCVFPYPFFLKYTNLISILKDHTDFVICIWEQGCTFDRQPEDWNKYIEKGLISKIFDLYRTGSLCSI